MGAGPPSDSGHQQPELPILPIAARPTGHQVRLLSTIWNAYAQTGRWPTFDYVERTLYGRAPNLSLNAQEVILDCPWIVRPHGLAAYGWVWASNSQHWSLNRDESLGLTVAGMHALPSSPEYRAAHRYVEAFLWALTTIVAAELSADPDPQGVVDVRVRETDLADKMPPHVRADVPMLKDVLDREPPTVRRVRTPEPGTWAVDPELRIRLYNRIDSVDAYLSAVAEDVAPAGAQPTPVAPSALSLPEAIDYLNEVWHRRAGAPLFDIRRADAAAKCALGCASKDEFDSRLSAVGEILAHMRLPGSDRDRLLIDLQQGLPPQLPDEAADRATGAIDDLRLLLSLRTWRQHSGTEPAKRARAAMARVGIQLPTNDWGGAWGRIQAFAVAALNALREEVELIEEIQSFSHNR